MPRKKTPPDSWVVYLLPLHGNKDPARALCSQVEWEALEAAQPGYHTLVRGGIANEGEAERLARGSAGDARRH